MAVLNGELDMVRTLIRRGAKVNTLCGPSSGQATALHAACLIGNLDVVRCLVEHGADLHRSADEGMDAMKIAAVRGRVATLEYLIQV